MLYYSFLFARYVPIYSTGELLLHLGFCILYAAFIFHFITFYWIVLLIHYLWGTKPSATIEELDQATYRIANDRRHNYLERNYEGISYVLVQFDPRNGSVFEGSIGLGDFILAEDLAQMIGDSNHLFHRSGIQEWLQEKFNCPLCKKKVVPYRSLNRELN